LIGSFGVVQKIRASLKHLLPISQFISGDYACIRQPMQGINREQNLVDHILAAVLPADSDGVIEYVRVDHAIPESFGLQKRI
jgi:hypothetical protein